MAVLDPAAAASRRPARAPPRRPRRAREARARSPGIACAEAQLDRQPVEELRRARCCSSPPAARRRPPRRRPCRASRCARGSAALTSASAVDRSAGNVVADDRRGEASRARRAPACAPPRPPARRDADARRRSAPGRGSRASRRGRRRTASPEALEQRAVALPAGEAAEREQAQRARPVVARGAGAGAKRSTSIAWPMPRNLSESSGNERRSTLSTRSARRVAMRSERDACQCVYQSSSGTRSGFASGAARVRKVGTMCTSTAAGRGRSDRASAASKRAPRPAFVLEPNVRKATFAGRSCRPTRSAITSTCSQRSASAPTASTVWASAVWSASTTCVTKTSRERVTRPRRRAYGRRASASRAAKSSAVWCQAA